MNFRDKILIKFDRIHQYLRELEEMIPAQEEKYVQDLTIKRACEKTIEIAVEEIIDIISIIVSEQQLGLPNSEDDLIKIIQERKILSPAVAKVVHQMKSFRNILVHRYGEIDDSKSFQYLTSELDDFNLFEKEIKHYLKRKK